MLVGSNENAAAPRGDSVQRILQDTAKPIIDRLERQLDQIRNGAPARSEPVVAELEQALSVIRLEIYGA